MEVSRWGSCADTSHIFAERPDTPALTLLWCAFCNCAMELVGCGHPLTVRTPPHLLYSTNCLSCISGDIRAHEHGLAHGHVLCCMPLPLRLGLDNYACALTVDTGPFCSQVGRGLSTRLLSDLCKPERIHVSLCSSKIYV